MRNSKGQSVTVLVLMLALIFLGSFSLFSINLSLVVLAREQLKAAASACALAAAAALCDADQENTMAAHQYAIEEGLKIFRQNLCLGNPLSNAKLSSKAGETASEGDCLLNFEFLDPNSNYRVLSPGDEKAKTIRVTASYGMKSIFSNYLQLPVINVLAEGSAGVPKMDIVIVFDVSGSMDDQTPVSFVKRNWGKAGKIEYSQITDRSAQSKGTIFDTIHPSPGGTGLNALAPQDLSAAAYDCQTPLYFSEANFKGHSAPGLRGSSENSPPGNKPGVFSIPSSLGSTLTFTDLVVNIDGNSTFKGISRDGFDFPDIATVVEAARGNLENETLFKSSFANSALKVYPKAGYQQAYRKLAQQNIHPLIDAINAVDTFSVILNNAADVHFGFVPFSSEAAPVSTSNTTKTWAVDQSWQNAGTTEIERSQLLLNASPYKTNFNELRTSLNELNSYGGTNIGHGIVAAIDNLKKGSRKDARKAIILFTDGQPTSGGPLSRDPLENARKAAAMAAKEGIPIYTVGLSQSAELLSAQKAILNDWNASPNDGGISAIAGNGGKFFLVTNQLYLRRAFQNIAREFVQMLRTNS